jgi:CRP/FNR family transcriptional regulator, dissimilatory nitrate respiration regulator
MIVVMSTELFELFLKSSERKLELAAGKFLFHANDPVDYLFLVIKGEVRLVRTLPDGAPLTLQRAGAGTVLAEASLFADYYHCDGQATEDSAVRIIEMDKARAALETEHALSAALLRHLASEVQKARSRAEMLSLKRVRAKLDAWIYLNGRVPPKGQWRQVASEISITPEALYREIARRKHP